MHFDVPPQSSEHLTQHPCGDPITITASALSYDKRDGDPPFSATILMRALEEEQGEMSTHTA